MRLNHINLAVTDLDRCAAFLTRYFELTEMGREKRMVFLRDDTGSIIALMEKARADYPPTFHIGFIQKNAAAVDAINERMKADGLPVKAPQDLHGRTFYVRAPGGGFMVEVLA